MSHIQKHVFVLKCTVDFFEQQPHEPPQLRGSLQHVTSGQEHHFNSVEAMIRYLNQLLGLPIKQESGSTDGD